MINTRLLKVISEKINLLNGNRYDDATAPLYNDAFFTAISKIDEKDKRTVWDAYIALEEARHALQYDSIFSDNEKYREQCEMLLSILAFSTAKTELEVAGLCGDEPVETAEKYLAFCRRYSKSVLASIRQTFNKISAHITEILYEDEYDKDPEFAMSNIFDSDSLVEGLYNTLYEIIDDYHHAMDWLNKIS